MNDSHVFDKVVSNVQEVRARGARVIAVATEGNSARRTSTPTGCSRSRAPRPSSRRPSRSLPLQILAYRIARLRGLPIDQPRNLAKTVTVE